MGSWKTPFHWKIPVVGKQPLQVNLRHARVSRHVEASKGVLLANPYSSWSDKIPHPGVMARLDEINSHPNVDNAITIMTEMVAAGFFTEMGDQDQSMGPDGKEQDYPNGKN